PRIFKARNGLTDRKFTHQNSPLASRITTYRPAISRDIPAAMGALAGNKRSYNGAAGASIRDGAALR
ncbi:MAG: hypothetical protein WAN27_17660, partial [Xanthobacteraceae bacterium]